MTDRSKSTSSVNTNATPSTISPEFATAMASVPWYANGAQEQQQQLHSIWQEVGVPAEEYAADALAFASAQELLAAEEMEAEDTAAEKAKCEEPAAPVAAEPTPTSTLKQANDTLDEFGKAVSKLADENYTLMPLAARYVDEFLGASPGKSTRTIAVERLAEEWRKHDMDSMSEPQKVAMDRSRAKVNLLLRINAVVQLLGDGRGVAKGNGTKKGRGKGKPDGRIAWGKLRELSPLVERDADDYAERWHVQPHVAEKAVALVAEVAASGMDREVLVAEVKKLVEEEQAARVAEAKQQADADKAEADAKRAEELRLRKELADKKREADALLEAARKPDAVPEVVQQATAATAAVAVKQAEVQVATVATEQATAKAATSTEADRKAQGKQADLDAKQAAKEKKAAERKAAKDRGEATPQAPPTPTAHQGTNLLAQCAAIADAGSTADIAGMCQAMVIGSSEPDSVLELQLQKLANHPELSTETHRRIAAFFAPLAPATRRITPAPVIGFDDRPVSPAQAAVVLAASDDRNGQLVAAQ